MHATRVSTADASGVTTLKDFDADQAQVRDSFLEFRLDFNQVGKSEVAARLHIFTVVSQR
jgi:hypothetical protein